MTTFLRNLLTLTDNSKNSITYAYMLINSTRLPYHYGHRILQIGALNHHYQDIMFDIS